MKIWTLQGCGLALIVAVLPLVGGCDQQEARSAPLPDIATNQPAPDSAAADTTTTNQPAPDATDQQLANAPGQIISTPDTAAANTNINPQLNDIVKLAQAGVGDSVLMAYVTNSPDAFNVSPDDIIYLNDLGLPETVVAAMLKRDQHFNGNAAPTPAPPALQPQPQPDLGTPVPPPEAPDANQNAMAAAPDATPPLTPPPAVVEDAEQAPNASYSYFYDSLSPYGNWVNIEGYGPCWQPTTVVVNPGWQPYCDRGHWAYTDCGWCWVSDYSWGWAPFHYGRWFRHNRFGWCWAPDTVWSPAWVSWRYSDSLCGWAALPPTACYRPGFGFTYFGRSVGFNFGFGLASDRFVFVSFDHFHDRSPGRFRVPHREISKIFNTTVVNNQLIRGPNNTLINRGVPVERIAAATHTEIRPVHLRADANGPGASQLGRDGRSLSVYRPALPLPGPPRTNSRLVGEGVQPDTRFDLRSRIERAPEARNNSVERPINPVTPASPMMPTRRPIISNPTANLPREQSAPDNSGRQNRFFQPQTPSQPMAPADNNRRIFTPTVREPLRPESQPQNSEAPNFNRPNNEFRRNGDFQLQQRELQQQQPSLPMPRQEAPTPRTFEAPHQQFQQQPRVNTPDYNSGFRSEPTIRSEPTFRSEPAAPREPQNNAPSYSAPSHQGNSQSSGGGGNGNGNGGGNGWGGGGNNGGRGNH